MNPYPHGGPPALPYAYPQSETTIVTQPHAAEPFAWTPASNRTYSPTTDELGYPQNVLVGRQPPPASQQSQISNIPNNPSSNTEFQILPLTVHGSALAHFASGRQNNLPLRPIPTSSSSLDGWNRVSGTVPGGDPQPPAFPSYGPMFQRSQSFQYASKPMPILSGSLPGWRGPSFESSVRHLHHVHISFT